jgi:hypothetical protein
MKDAGADVASGSCANCGKTRPLWRYRPAHRVHLDEVARQRCPWCARSDEGIEPPPLCVRCWSAEAELEAKTPLTRAEKLVLHMIIRPQGRGEGSGLAREDTGSELA